jgi:putative membrane protein
MPSRGEPRLLSLAIRLGINAAALWLASEWVRGFEIEGWQSLVATAAIFGLVNALIRPVAQFVGLPLTCLTAGIFIVVINVAMMALTVWIADAIDLDVTLDGFWAVLCATLLVSAASWALSTFVGTPLRRALR